MGVVAAVVAWPAHMLKELRALRKFIGEHATSSQRELIEIVRKERHTFTAKADIWTQHAAYSRCIETTDEKMLQSDAIIMRAQELISSLYRYREREEMSASVETFAARIRNQEHLAPLPLLQVPNSEHVRHVPSA